MRFAALMLVGLLFGRGAVEATELCLGSHTTVTWATAGAAADVLGTRDTFLTRLSPFDRAARMHTDRVVAEEEFIRHLRDSVQEWTEADRGRVVAAWELIEPRLTELNLPFPGSIGLIATSGAEEGGAAYTRGTSIVIPAAVRNKSARALSHLLAHEAFHILSRANPVLRDRLYACIGFRPCGELDFPENLRARRITNPDAPELRHAIAVTIDGRSVLAMPILLANADTYNVVRGGQFFDYLKVKLLVIESRADRNQCVAVQRGGEPWLVDIGMAQGYFEQVGRNTDYVIHPEEILADNFVRLLFRTKSLPSPEVVGKMQQVLAAAARI